MRLWDGSPVAVCFVVFVYYAVVIACSIRDAIYSVDLAWGTDPGSFFSREFLHLEGAAQYSLTPVGKVMILLVIL